MLDNVVVGNQIAFLRKQNNLTQEELADKLGITAQAISKWENGHTLPETALLPSLAEIFKSSIDAILMPFAARDSAFQDFTRAVGGEQGELALQLYQKLHEKLYFTVTYDEKFHIFDAVHNGCSAKFNIPEREDFIIRIDVEAGAAGNHLAVRMPLNHCSGYMSLADKMPEHIKQSFRYNDCKSCTCNCPYCMVYTFEGTEYKQCHFMTVYLNSAENMEHIFALACAEYEMLAPDKKRV